MSKKVIVTDISPLASEKTVKDFFLFCGKIKEFELIKEESSDKQIAFVTFERDAAAKTALMLTNAVIGDSQITVKSADDASNGCEDSDGDIGQEDKPKAAIFAEILAAGYTLQDSIIQRGIDFDNRLGISKVFCEYLNQLQANIKDLDQKYQVSEAVTTRAIDINNKYSVYDNAKFYYDQARVKATTFFETSAGKIIMNYLCCTQKKVTDVQNMARKIANDKKSDRDYNPVPSHSHSDEQVSDQLISTQ